MYRDFSMSGDFSKNTDFAFVYIEEAHATDEWPISSSRYMPNNEICSVQQPQVLAERVALATKFVTMFGMGPEMKVLVDDPKSGKGNMFESAYAPWPIRIFVIENGVMQFISSPTECSHDVTEVRYWLDQRHYGNK